MFKMILKTLLVVFFLAVCAAVPLEETRNEGLQSPANAQGVPQGDVADLDADSTFWGGYYRYPIYRRSFIPYYRPRYYHSYYPRYYWHTYW